MTEPLMMGYHVRWAVAWVVKKNKKLRLFEKEFENDLAAAMELYMKAKRAEKPMATLISRNVAFPPPKRFQPYEAVRITTVPRTFTKTVKTKSGKRKKKTISRMVEKRTPLLIVPMEKVNEKGVWWCPYCREMRRFRKQEGFRVDGKYYVAEPGYFCPICRISHRNHHVRHWNPEAARTPQDMRQKRTRKATKKVGRRTRRSR